MKKAITLLLLIGALTGCKQKEIVEIKPSEVAYEINNFSLGGNDKTQKFDGTRDDYSKVRSSSKMITVPYERISTGALPIINSRKLPLKKVIIVSQSIVSKEWVKELTKGSNKTDDSFSAGSSNGAEFTIGVTLSAKITDTDTYVSIYGVDPSSRIDDVRVESMSLNQVLEKTVKPYIQGELSAEFGKLQTGQVQPRKNDVISAVAKRTKERFSKDGIDIITFNISGDVYWLDQKIQQSINQTAQLLADREKVEAQQKVESTQAQTRRIVAEQKAMEDARKREIDAEVRRKEAEYARLAEEENNKKALAKAQNDRLIALEKAKQETDVANEKAKVINTEKQLLEIDIKRAELDVMRKTAEAKLVEMTRWNGKREYSELTIQGASSVVGRDGEVKTLQLVK